MEKRALRSATNRPGSSLDEARNRSVKNSISDPESRCSALVLASQEDEQIARHTWAFFPNRIS
jgi:acetate kinase